MMTLRSLSPSSLAFVLCLFALFSAAPAPGVPNSSETLLDCGPDASYDTERDVRWLHPTASEGLSVQAVEAGDAGPFNFCLSSRVARTRVPINQHSCAYHIFINWRT